MRLILILSAYAGLRFTEMTALRREDIIEDATPPVMIIRNGRCGEDRLVPVPEGLLEEMHRAGVPDQGAMLRRPSYLPYTPKLLSMAVSRHMHRCGLGGAAHLLRTFHLESSPPR
jgi:hypothetical protein